MKNFKIILAAVVFGITTLLSVSCQPDNPAPQQVSTNPSTMVGNWKFDFIRNITYTGTGNPIVITDSTIYDTPMAGQWYEVTLSQFIFHVGTVPSASSENYTISGNTITFGSSDVYSIVTLNQTKMRLRKQLNSSQYTERHYTRQ